MGTSQLFSWDSCREGILPLALACSVLVPAQDSSARDFVLTGGLELGYEFYNRQYEEQTSADENEAATDGGQGETSTSNTPAATPDDDEYSRFRITPVLAIATETARDEMELRYRPSYRYDIDTEEDDFDHDVKLNINRYLTRTWQLRLDDSFVWSDVVTDQTGQEDNFATQESAESDGEQQAGGDLSDSEGRRTYWTNDAGLESVYEYWEDSLATAGYRFSMLRNEEGGETGNYEDYDRHDFFLENEHRFNSTWKLTIIGHYIRGFFDRDRSEAADGTSDTDGSATTETGAASDETEVVDNDLREYRARTSIESSLVADHLLSFTYGFYGVDFDDPESRGATIHDGTLGWRWQMTKDFYIDLGGGPTYRETDGLGDDWGYNGYFTTEYRRKSVWIRLSGDKGYDRQNFRGTDEQGLLDYYQARIDLGWTPLKDLSITLFGIYRNEDQEEITSVEFAEDVDQNTPVEDRDLDIEIENYTRERYRAGMDIGYDLGQWYKVKLSYTYAKQDSERDNDSYEEHRATVSLSYERDLFRW